MIKKLQQNGNSRSLIINKEMLSHLEIADTVEVQYVEGGILLSNPEAKAKRFAEAFSRGHDPAMRRLAE